MRPSLGRALSLAWLSVSACQPAIPNASGPTTPEPQPIPSLCSLRFDEPDLPLCAEPPDLDVPQSEVVVALSFEPSTLAARLAREVPPRVASARDVDAGVAGKLSYRIDRSPFAVDVRDDRLFVSTRLTARADLCKPLGPLGCVQYANCSPAANAIASIPLSLGSSYQLGPASVAIRVTRPCQIGGLNATPRIQQGANAQARHLQRRINTLLPSFSNDAQLLWNAMGVHVPLGIDSRLRIQPDHVVQGPPREEGQLVTIPLGVRGTVRIEPRQGQRHDPGRIPPPRTEPDLESGLRLHVPIDVDLDALDTGLSRSVRGPIEPKNATRILSVRTRPTDTGLLLLATIQGPSCGTVAFRASPDFDDSSGRIILSNVSPLPSEVERLHALDPSLDLHLVARCLERGQVAPAVDPFTIPKGLERSVELLASDDGPDVRITVADARVDRVVSTRSGVAAVVEVIGNAQVVLR